MPGYKITVKTGNIDDAGTDAQVFITLIGAKNTSAEFPIDSPDPDVNDFERNSVGEYIVNTDQLLGDLRQIRIRHDNSHNKSGWFLDFVDVLEMSSPGKTRNFPCFRWLATDEGDYKIDRILNRRLDVQNGWRWCKKCRGLTFAGGGACPAGGFHDSEESFDYRIDMEGHIKATV